MTFAKYVRDLAADNGKSVADIAKAVGLSSRTFSAKIANPGQIQLGDLMRMAKAMNLQDDEREALFLFAMDNAW